MPAAASPPSPRVEIVREPSRLLVRLRQPLPPRLLYGIFLGFFLAGTLAGLVALFTLFAGGRVEGPTATAAGMWLVALLFGVGFAGWAFFRAVLADEVIEVGSQALALRHVAGPIRIGTSYLLGGVRNLRREERPRSGSFAFDHGGRTVRFGFGLAGPAAEEVLAAIRERTDFPGGSAR